MKNFPYTLNANGIDVNGKTNEYGRTQYGWTRQSEQIKLTLHHEQFNRMILDAKDWDEDEPLQLDFAEELNMDNTGQ